ncbi:MAG: peptidoglycan bridge formation glycyltransferase FemA/FemB family protein [Candidatus Parcubacteria bacterium]|nr:peptidoglycan bridge formation glycyltransferase FemA/FemB family protein [Candidatus Parcubacteria bacterium]
MKLKGITTKEQWEQKMSSQSQAQFLQSWEWGEFQKRLGRQIWRLEIEEEYILVIKMPLPLGWNYLYIPRTRVELTQSKVDVLKELAGQEKSLFIRVEPVKQDLAVLGFAQTKQVQPTKTLMLDLSLSEEELLAQMHQKTRYNIRLADKKRVKLLESREEQFVKFYDLLLDTYRRKDKGLHSRNYYQKLYLDHISKIYFAEYEGKILCANMMIYYGDTMTYLHGGSSPEDKNIMAPHLLQWEQIKMAKSQGYKYYDFWGIDENKWPGVTRFKKGFGGFEVDYSGTWELPVNKGWYGVYKFLKRYFIKK